MNSLTQKSDRALTAAALAALVAVLLIMEMTMKSTSILLTVLKKGGACSLWDRRASCSSAPIRTRS